MTITQAYKIIGVTKYNDIAEIERAYRQKLKKIQLQLTPGNSLPIRQRALQKIERLSSAMEVIQKNPPQTSDGTTAYHRGPTQSQSQSRVPQFQFNWQTLFASVGALPLPRSALLISIVLSVLMMLSIALACFNTLSRPEGKTTAQLRIVTVPVCQVEVDGRLLGASNQTEPYELAEGRYQLTFKRENQQLTQTIKMYADRETIVEVQFDQGLINVSYESL